MPPAFQLQLLDAAQGQVLQTWELSGVDVVRIGRSPDNDIVLGSQYVSRAHAYLQADGDRYRLSTLSQQGLFVDGQRCDSVVLEPGLVFRLAAKGPFLRFDPIRSSDDDHSTISLTPEDAPLLILDTAERDRQVDEIAEDEYFQNLREAAGALRRRRPPSPSS